MADGLHNQIASAIAADALTVVGGTASQSTMRGSVAGPTSNLGPAPQTVVGPPNGRITPGSWEVIEIKFPVRVYTAKLRNATQTQHDVNEWLDAFIAAYRTGITFGLSALGVMQVVIDSWNTDAFYEVGGEPYQAIDFTVSVYVASGQTYTP